MEALGALAEIVRKSCIDLIARAGFDRTCIGQVTIVHGDGTYTVAAFGGNYRLPYKTALTVGAVVRVKLPQNVWKDMYIESVE